jgi:hypothetical protein
MVSASKQSITAVLDHGHRILKSKQHLITLGFIKANKMHGKQQIKTPDCGVAYKLHHSLHSCYSNYCIDVYGNIKSKK